MAIEGAVRTRMANCPSCGGPLRFRGATSIVAVCAFCRATLVREGVRLEDVGKQAELLPDDTLLQVGTTGRHRGEPFTIAGRIQYRYESGLWNEWHVLFDNGKSAWLSDASRDYTIAYLSPPAEVPAFEALKPGMAVTLLGERYGVTNLEEAEVIAGEGELPFRFTAGWKAPVADLRGPGARFATIDYSEDVPHIYLGERLPFDAFGFAGLRDPDRPVEAQGRALAFKCGGCGAPISKHVAATKVVACESCGTVTDVAGTIGEIVQRNETHKPAFGPSIPLGTTGKWRGVDYEVVGYLRRQIVVEGERYEWVEYLLHNLAQGYLWVSEYEGHFSVVKDAAETPKEASALFGVPRVRYLGREFVHFQKSEPRVVFLAGEFYWRVKLGDTCRVDDYVAPPLILSSEATENEITWSLGEYVEPEVLWKALGLKSRPPTRKGVAPNQPSPHAGGSFGYWAAFLAFAAVAFVLQFGFMAANSGAQPGPLSFAVPMGAPTRFVSPVFELGGREGTVNLRTTSSARQSWLNLDMQLVDADTGRAWRVSRQLGLRSLARKDEATSDDLAEILRVPGGRYTLAIDASAGAFPDPRGRLEQQVTGEVRLYRPASGWSNLALLLGFLVLWPLVAWGRAAAFERARWAESDHATSSTDDDDD
ncbi:MAG: DUF4178 domain-containing protein [Burkholderiales bacterium]